MLATLSPGGERESSPKIISPAPPVLPQLLADGAGDARLVRRRRNDARLGLPAGDFQNQFCARRIDELFGVVDRYDERAGAADHAVFVIDVEVLDIHRV